MVVLSNELRNLLTEDSISAIMTAGNSPNNHLIPENNVQTNIAEVEVEHPDVQATLVDVKTGVDVSDLKQDIDSIKSLVKNNVNKYDNHFEMMATKINDLIKAFNEIESKVIRLDREIKNPSSVQQPQVNTALVEEKKPPNPRSVDSLPPELSIESVFNCNGKIFN